VVIPVIAPVATGLPVVGRVRSPGEPEGRDRPANVAVA
jgi:hypothetical protein